MLKILIFSIISVSSSSSLANIWSRQGDQRTDVTENVLGDRQQAVEFNFGFNKNSGNVNQQVYSTGLALAKKIHSVGFYMKMQTFFAESNDFTVQNQKSLVLRADYPIEQKLRLFTFSTHAANEFLRLDYRSTLGLGPWYDWVGEKWTNGLSLAPVFFYEEFGGVPRNREWRVSFRSLFGWKIDDKSRWGYDFFFAPRAKHLADLQVFFQPFFETKIYKESVSLKMTYTVEYDSRSLDGIKSTDTQYMTSLNFKFD